MPSSVRLGEERYRHIAAVVEWSNDAIIGSDIAGNISIWNRSAQRLFGYDEDEVLGRPLVMLSSVFTRAYVEATCSSIT
jgi:PAS domain S-box-containing protein